MTFAALEATLELYRDPELALREIPVLQMLTLSPRSAGAPSTVARGCDSPPLPRAPPPRLTDGTSVTGGGSFPAANLPTTLVVLDPGPRGADSLALALRLGDPPVVARVENGVVVLDPRTLPEELLSDVAAAIAVAYGE